MDNQQNEQQEPQSNGDVPYDPRNEEDFDTWSYGTEPLPHDKTWHSK